MKLFKIILMSCMAVFIFSQCEENDADVAVQTDLFFPLKTGNKWEYEVTRRNNGYSSNNRDYIQTIEITNETNGVFTIVSKYEGSSDLNLTYKLKKGSDGIYTQDGKLLVSGDNKTTNEKGIILLFQTHFNVASLNTTGSFVASGNLLKFEFTEGIGTIFSQTFTKGVGLSSWTNQKNTSGYYGWVSDTYRGTLTQSVIDGEITNY